MPTHDSEYIALAAAHSGFQDRIGSVFSGVALDVAKEVDTTPDHAERLAFASALLKNEIDWEQVTRILLNLPGVAGDLKDDPSNWGSTIDDTEMVNGVTANFTAISIMWAG